MRVFLFPIFTGARRLTPGRALCACAYRAALRFVSALRVTIPRADAYICGPSCNDWRRRRIDMKLSVPRWP